MTRPRTIGILGLQGAVAEHGRALESLGADTRVVRDPHQLTGVAGLVVPGGESTTISRLAVELGLLAPIRDAVADGLPIFGTCAGMIMLADRILDGRPDQESFGGLDIVVRRNAFGRQRDSFEVDVDLRGLDAPFPGVFIRAPWVESVGPGVQVLASLSRRWAPPLDVSTLGTEEPHAVAVQQGRVLATAFHPELTPDVRLHQVFLDLIEQCDD